MNRKLLIFSFVAMLSGCMTAGSSKDDVFYLKQARYEDLPSWQQSDMAGTMAALQNSCVRIANKAPSDTFGPDAIGGSYADWQSLCAKLPVTDARKFFEENFIPYAVIGNDGRDGLFTGYYEPTLASSAAAKVPLYAKPDDLITVNLGDFNPELKGETIAGRVNGDKLVPYYTRAEIEKGALGDKAKKIALVDSDVDAFFLQIQGSGTVKNADGGEKRVGYAAQNGHVYTAIGKELLASGELKKEDVSMQSIRAWLAAHPDRAAEMMNRNKSFVFFRDLGVDGVLGAEGVALTPGYSLAVDRKKLPYGAPVFVDAEAPEGGGAFRRLMVAQDTGGAIRGAVRGDVFWGAGDQAAHNAGIMKSKGRAWLLLPKTAVVPEKFLK